MYILIVILVNIIGWLLFFIYQKNQEIKKIKSQLLEKQKKIIYTTEEFNIIKTIIDLILIDIIETIVSELLGESETGEIYFNKDTMVDILYRSGDEFYKAIDEGLIEIFSKYMNPERYIEKMISNYIFTKVINKKNITVRTT